MHVVDKNIFQAVISGIARATFKRKEFSADTRFLPLYPSPLHPVKRKIRGMGGGGIVRNFVSTGKCFFAQRYHTSHVASQLVILLCYSLVHHKVKLSKCQLWLQKRVWPVYTCTRN